MEKITFSEFLAEIQTIFANYTDSNDLDTVSIKGWVIDRLRVFGKNICDHRELIVGVENSKALLPENFKSLILALKINTEGLFSNNTPYREVPTKRYITNDVQWDSISQSYVKNNCQSQEVIESLIILQEPIEKYASVSPLSLVKGIQKSALDANCYNLHPSIRNAYEHQISITNRSLSTNFKKGLIYLQYNSLPEQDGEIAIPVITTSDILKYITNYVKIKIAESIILNNRNPNPGLQGLMQLWLQQDRQFFNEAKSESNYYGLGNNWKNRIYQKRQENMNRFNLPK